MRLTARVPATVANLGPGFDVFGLALALHNEITVDTGVEGSIAIDGEGSDELPADDSNLVVRAMNRFAEVAEAPLPSFGLHSVNRIPLERGLGSSAAAVVGGLCLASRLLERTLETESIVRIAAELEGHADNVAAAVVGGLAIVYETDGGERVERLQPAGVLRPVILIPDRERISTRLAREVLARDVPREDATFNASRAALLTIALTSRPDLLEVALQDRLHQERRLELAPKARKLFAELVAAHVPVCVAGSGPTLLAFEIEERAVPDPGAGWRVLRIGIDIEGAKVLEQGPSGG